MTITAACASTVRRGNGLYAGSKASRRRSWWPLVPEMAYAGPAV